MKKNWIALVTALFILGSLGAQERRPMDLVVVMDTSSGMFGFYREISEYVIGPLLGEFLRVGDTFHLISFAGAPRMELSRRIEGRGDVETIVGRMLLMYPLGLYSDSIAALEYIARYLSDLPEIRPKTVVFISDGRHEPPPGSPYAGLSLQAVQERISATAETVRGNGWDFHFLRVPFDEERKAMIVDPQEVPGQLITGTAADPTGPASVSGLRRPDVGIRDVAPGAVPEVSPISTPLDVSATLSEELNAPIVEWTGGESTAETLTTAVGSIAAVFPEHLGRTGKSVTMYITVRNPSPSPIFLETTGILVDGVDRMTRRSFKELAPRTEGSLALRIELPDGMEPGLHDILVEPLFAGSIRIHPQSGRIGLELVAEHWSQWAKDLLPLALFLPGLILAGLLALVILLAARRLHGAPNRVAAEASGPVPRDGVALSSDRTVTAAEGAPIGRPAGSGASDAELLSSFVERGSAYRPTEIVSNDKAKSTLGNAASDAALLASFAAAGNADRNRSIARLPLGGLARAQSVPHAPLRPVNTIPYEVRRAHERILLSLHVEDQSTAIGKRNVHLIKAGQTLSIGGKRSDFLIFLVPIPHRIADLRFDGDFCILVPRQPEFFPDSGAEPIVNCVGRTVRILSEKGYELKIRFDKYRDPLESLNRFLHSIELPG